MCTLRRAQKRITEVNEAEIEVAAKTMLTLRDTILFEILKVSPLKRHWTSSIGLILNKDSQDKH